MRGWRALLVATTLAIAASVATPARAGEPSERDRKAAQASFQEAQKAFKAGDFRHAAEKFDEAYKRAPHHAPLWNAGRAWHRAGELTRAANIYAKYLREAPPKAPDRNRAIVALKEVQAKLGRIDVHATDVSEVTVDGERFEGEGVYVIPGAHVVEGKTTNDAHESVRVPQSVAAGETVSVALVPPTPPPAAAPAPAPVAVLIPATAPPPSTTAPHASSGISPAFFVVGTVLTLAAGGVTVWSGLDVQKKKDDYLGGAQTQDKYDAGKSAELRTNVLLGVTGGLALLTAVTGLFLVDWKGGDGGRDRVTAHVGPGQLFVEGTF